MYMAVDSLSWYERSTDGRSICANCVWKYHGASSVRSLERVDTNVELPPFMFRPVKEEQHWTHV